MEATHPQDRMSQFQLGTLPSIFYVPDFVDATQEQQFIDQIHSAPRTKWRELKNRRLQYWGGMVHEKGMIPEPVPRWLEDVMKDIVARTDMFPAPLNHVLINEYLPGQGIMPHQDGPLYFPVVAILSLGSPAVMRFTPRNSCAPEAPATLSSSFQSACGEAALLQDSRGGKMGPEAANQEKEELSSALPNQAENSPKQTDTTAQNATSSYASASGPSNGFESEKLINDHGNRHESERPCKPPECSVVLMPRSLLIFKDEAYTDYLHGIDETLEHVIDDSVVNPSILEVGCSECVQRETSSATAVSSVGVDGVSGTLARKGPRLSLTCRRVLKVKKALIRL